MKRFWHYLKTNQNSETIQNCIFVDCETDSEPRDKGFVGYKLRFGWACHTIRNGRGEWTKPSWKRFTDPDEFWLWAMSYVRPKEKLWMWCHNGNFDYPVLDAFMRLIDLKWSLKTAIIDGPPIILKYRQGTKTLMLVDTLNIWRMSLAELGEKVGLEKLTLPEKWGDIEGDDYYCRRDVEIIYKAVTEWTDFLRSNDMGGFRPTIAGQAMRSFRHRWMDHKILIDADESALDVARKAYHGGRCECAFVGWIRGRVHNLDVNSMYPYVMSYLDVPVRLRGFSRYVQVYHLKRLLDRYALCARVRLNTPEPFAAVIHEGKLVFPTGRFDCYLSTPEIKYAVERGYVEEVWECASYDHAPAFSRFALELYAFKELAVREGRKIDAEHWKLLLNSFYGKWGQSGKHWVKVGTCKPNDFSVERIINAQTHKITFRRHFGGHILERAKDPESMESHPAIAAHITAEARMVLWAIIKQCPPKTYFYCDTDAVFVSDEGLEALRDRLHEYRLGFLKHKATYTDTILKGPKDYVLDGEATLKGIRAKAIDLGNGKYAQLKWVSLKGLLAAGSTNMPLTKFIDKTLSRVYTKGIVGSDGFVTPLHFSIDS